MCTTVTWLLDQARTRHMIRRGLEAAQKLTPSPDVSPVVTMAGARSP